MKAFGRNRWRSWVPRLAAMAAVGVLVAACGEDEGADVRELEGSGSESASGSGSGSGSGSASGSGSGSGSASEASGSTAAQVPEGVADQYATLEAEIAAEGGETTSGPWRVAYIVEPAEPWFEADSTFRAPADDETYHIEIIPIEAETGRVVPDVPIRLEVVDADGTVVDARDLNFYYAEFFHYANNFAVPDAGTYTLRATLDAPGFLRHGEEGETPALAEGAAVEFTDVELEPES